MTDQDQKDTEMQLDELQAMITEFSNDANTIGEEIDRLAREVDTEYKAAEEELGKLTVWLEEEAAKSD